MNNQKTFTKTEHGRTSSLTVDVIDGVYCYGHIKDIRSPLGVRITPPSVLKEYNADIPARQKELHEQANDAIIADYCKLMENHEPDVEEQFEMRQAFGEGAKVVNVITGQKYSI